MTRPRRSRNLRTSSHDHKFTGGLRRRAITRQVARSSHGMGAAAHAPVASGRTVWSGLVADLHHWDRQYRLQRAEAAHEQAVVDIEEAREAVFCAWGLHPTALGSIHRSVDAHEATCARRLDAARVELVRAQRSASRPVGDLVTPPLVSLPQPRTWPNAPLLSRHLCNVEGVK